MSFFSVSGSKDLMETKKRGSLLEKSNSRMGDPAMAASNTSEALADQRPLSPSLQHYLEIIYREELQHGTAHASNIADCAGVSRATVTSTLKALRGMGLIEYAAYSPIRLTEEGRRIGSDLMHRHIICREFFQNILGFDEAQAAAVASELEHLVPRHVVRRLGQFNLYMQDKNDFWNNWQEEYSRRRDELDATATALGQKAGLAPEENAELSRKYR